MSTITAQFLDRPIFRIVSEVAAERGVRAFVIGGFPSPLLIATGEAIPLRGLEGVPGLPGAPQDEAGLTRTFETRHVGGYKPVAINLTENYKEITMGEDSDSSSTLVEGFSFCCSQLHPFEKITCAFYSGLGYSSSGSGNSIPSFAGLRFEIDVVAKP